MSTPASGSLLLEKLRHSWPLHLWQDHRQLVAVSGGADSVALLRALVHLSSDRNRLIVAHFNHGWRGLESDDDERFVRELCSNLGLELLVGRASPIDSSMADVPRTEESARRLRYEFLIRSAYQSAARYVLTAHTASDRVETMLHHLFRGTGLAGVTKPALLRPLDDELVLVRPLIACFRQDVEEYLTEIGQSFCQDSSNSDEAYRRNFLRQSLLPVVRQAYGPSVDRHLLSFSIAVEETVETLDQMAEQYWQKVGTLAGKSSDLDGECVNESPMIRFPTSAVLHEHWPVVRHALQAAWSARRWPRKGVNRSHWQCIYRFWSRDLGTSLRDGQLASITRQVKQLGANSESPPAQTLASSIRVSLVDGWVTLECQLRPGKKDK